MKTTKILTILVLAFGLIVCLPKIGKASPMGTGFTYQGRLIDANNAADGLYDFQFKLYDANVAGTQKGSTLNIGEVDVIDGYFTVSLDFGSGVFDGNDRWLQIGVRAGNLNDPNAYMILTPRQKVTPTPYALYADNADKLDGYHAGNSSGQVSVSNGTQCVNLNADVLDGFHAGNSSGQVALNNGTLCTNLNADRLDGIDASSFLSTGNDYGRSGVSSTLYEGTTALSNKYLGISATATNSDLLDGQHASSFLSTGSDYGRSGFRRLFMKGQLHSRTSILAYRRPQRTLTSWMACTPAPFSVRRLITVVQV